MQMELSYIHMSVRLAVCNITAVARIMVVNDNGSKVKSQANQNAVTDDRK